MDNTAVKETIDPKTAPVVHIGPGQLIRLAAMRQQHERQINISVDYDETITTNPQGWLKIMELLHELGMTVYVVTYRHARLEEEFDLEYLKHFDFIEGLIFTGRSGKKKFCEDLGINIDIWIDDNPITITHSMRGIDAGLFYSFTPDQMEVRLVAPPKSIEQAQYEHEVYNANRKPH